jgi:acetone carboxylase gamma subunit
MAEYDIREIEQLVDGTLPWPRVQEIMKAPKDRGRFAQWVAILQKRVRWAERILLPLTPHLYIVQKGRARIVKCDCGHEFGDYRINWKTAALIHVRDDAASLGEIYRGREMPDPAWVQIREYYCPGCAAQLEVESVPRGCPPDFEFLPDLDTFYREWLDQPLDDDGAFVDKTLDAVAGWKE